ncbi:MAG: alpha/beta hydrolase [Pirellulales bacterium]
MPDEAEEISAQPDPAPTTAPTAKRRRRLPWPLRFGLLILAAYLLVVIAMAFLENSLIFFPAVYPEGDWQPGDIAVEDAWFETEDGFRLHGWYVAADHPRAVVLFAHGNGGNITHRIDILDALPHALGASVLAFDYRGYGRSDGHPSEAGVLADARAARRWLAKRAGVAESQIVLMGESLGGAVVVDLAAEDGARGLVLESTFTSLPDVAAFHYPWLPVKLVMRSQLNSAAKIRDYHGPLLQFHGDMDRIIPFKLGQRLFEAANEPKQFVIIPFGDHNDPRPRTFYEELDRFLGALPAQQP